MTTSSQFAELAGALENPPRGVVGFVDDLLRLCPEHGVQLDWHSNQCRIRAFQNGSNEVLERPLRQSVFRAILARVAALCNVHTPNSISPFRGQGEFVMGTHAPALFEVSFVNTEDEQKLVLIPVTTSVEVQKLVESLQRAYGNELQSAIDTLKLDSSFIRIAIKIASKAVCDRGTRWLIRQLLSIDPCSGECWAAVFGDVDEVKRILEHAKDGNDDLCLTQLEKYAIQIVACIERAKPQAAQSASDEPNQVEQDIW
jgi:hypothetical protein